MRGRTTKGYIWRRGLNGKHLPVDSTLPGIYYYTWTVSKVRRTKCLDTEDRGTAEARANLIRSGLLKDLPPDTHRSRHIAHLTRIIAAGEKARTELVEILTNAKPVRVERVSGILDAILDGTLSRDAKAAWRAFLREKPAFVKTMRDISPELAQRYVAAMQKRRNDDEARRAAELLAEIHGAADPNGPNPWRNVRLSARP